MAFAYAKLRQRARPAGERSFSGGRRAFGAVAGGEASGDGKPGKEMNYIMKA